jgi:hypothetical protein
VNPLGECPRPEEFSALLDRELAPEEIPTLERHVGECRICRELFLRLSAADRMFRLVLGKVDLVGECLAVKPAKEDNPSEKLLDELGELGRIERLRVIKDVEHKVAKRRGKRRWLVFLFLVIVGGAFAGALQPSPIAELGTARRKGAFVVGPGELTLHRGAKLRLSDEARVRFWCAFRWEAPVAELHGGRMTLLKGKLVVKTDEALMEMQAGQTAIFKAAGKADFEKADLPPDSTSKPPASTPKPSAKPESPPEPKGP